MPMKHATETVWETADGKLVPAGDPSAAFLFAAKGQPVPDKKVAKLSADDVEKFFEDPNADPGAAKRPKHGTGGTHGGHPMDAGSNKPPEPENRDEETREKIGKRKK